ncbi:2TM domain-containing protein [Polaribacter pectinis]|uniref:2TM domain-containing protein n=1 Tax=Polaribacter pectinis TaxID=2738844 RepID=A0A7G9LBY5_9FLAO|nr:2TM domain-containing protein [Polaribacter pectinis]QNM86134.1 2TM domain-containing protein [Polaribacter pectinis]
MKQDFVEAQQYAKAKKRVRDIKAFYTHLSVYCVIIPVIIFTNLKFEPHFHWFWFSLVGWGLGLFCHWLSVFGIRLLGLEKNWEDRKIKEFMNEEKK